MTVYLINMLRIRCILDLYEMCTTREDSKCLQILAALAQLALRLNGDWLTHNHIHELRGDERKATLRPVDEIPKRVLLARHPSKTGWPRRRTSAPSPTHAIQLSRHPPCL